MGKRLIILLSILTLLAYGWPAWTRLNSIPPTKETSFSSPPHFDQSVKLAPFIKHDFINSGAVGAMVHVGSICEMTDEQLAAVWYGGTREGAKDVAIFFSTKLPGINTSWSNPRVIVDRDLATRELKRYIRKVGNPVLFSGSGKQLWLIYVSITVGGWSGSSLNLKTSQDGGDTWTESQRLTLSPFFNISELVKGRPLQLKTMGERMNQDHFAVPIYHEFLGNFPEILWISFFKDSSRIVYEKSRMAGGKSFIQPSIAALDTHIATAFYRSVSTDKRIAAATTEDCGQNWTAPDYLDLPNPDSAVDALPLPENCILLAFNDSRNSREIMQLALSKDGGQNWTRIHTLENSPNEEFSYPFMIRGRNGLIHVVYTWKRKRIKHLVFNEAWIEQQVARELDK